MPKNKVLTLYQKAKICKMSLTPGFNKEKCKKNLEFKEAVQTKFFNQSPNYQTSDSKKKKHSKCNICDIQR